MEDKKLELYDVVKYSTFRLKISESNNNYIITQIDDKVVILLNWSGSIYTSIF
jgi:hypothetical protein